MVYFRTSGIVLQVPGSCRPGLILALRMGREGDTHGLRNQFYLYLYGKRKFLVWIGRPL